MRGSQVHSGSRSALSHREARNLLRYGVLLSVVIIAAMVVSGCSGLVSGSNASTTTPPSTLTITSVQAISHTTSTYQIACTNKIAPYSAVDYSTSISHCFTTTVEPT